ncbi:glycosyltransferase family 2 protein [Sphingosinicella terrae]|uniref:glycosyltransferase family 2 protein n=1 Tax=Sphingosinicella terrae TaxID=2172047 RepID=UPI000E0CE550|nr:glycosyltransferase family 2 protein [Sphingosinicella terrae]
MSVSVIVTTYNDGEYLPDCLASVARQTRAADQVIVVDDGSTSDRALAGIAAGLEAHPRTLLLRQQNRGPSAARNNGLEAASGTFIAFLDADDRWAPENLERRLALIERDERVVAAYSGFLARAPEGAEGRSSFREHLGPLEPRLVGVPGGLPGGLPLYLLRRQAAVDAGGLDPSLTIMEDFDFLIRIGRQQGLFAGNNDPLYLRTVRPGSLTRASADRRYRGTLQFLRKASEQRYFSRFELARRRAFAIAAHWRQRLRSKTSA